jgi:putative hydrolase of HD superfamily
MTLGDELQARGVSVNMERLLRMALLHDWAETRVGDMPKTATGYFGSEIRKRAESAAFLDIVNGAGSFGSLYRELYDDYEQRKSLEARLVKAADVIDLLIQVLALERAGARGLGEFWEVMEAGDFQLEGAAREILSELFAALLAARRDV